MSENSDSFFKPNYTSGAFDLPIGVFINGVFPERSGQSFTISTTLGLLAFQVSGEDFSQWQVSRSSCFNTGLDFAVRFFNTNVCIISPSEKDSSSSLSPESVYSYDADLDKIMSSFECHSKPLKIFVIPKRIIVLTKTKIFSFNISTGLSAECYAGKDFVDADFVETSAEEQLIAFAENGKRELIVLREGLKHMVKSPFQNGGIHSVVFSPDSKNLLVVSDNLSQLVIYETQKFEESFRYSKYVGKVNKIFPSDSVYFWLFSSRVVLVYTASKEFHLIDFGIDVKKAFFFSAPLTFKFSTKKNLWTDALNPNRKPFIHSKIQYYDQSKNYLTHLTLSIFHLDGTIYKLSYNPNERTCSPLEAKSNWIKVAENSSDHFVMF